MDNNGLLVFGLSGQSVFLNMPHFHRPQETMHATSLYTEPGGKGFNQAIAAARLGSRVAFVGAVGGDGYGATCQERLHSERIKAKLIIKKEAQTAYAVILTDGLGDNRVTVFPGAELTAKDVMESEPWFRDSQVLLLTSEIPHEAFNQAVSLGRQYGLKLVINPAPYKDWVEQYLEEAWCITPNSEEAREMLGLKAGRDLREVAQKSSYKRMIITMGGDGALCIEKGIVTHLPAAEVDVVDTTGAGDALSGAFSAALLQGYSFTAAAAIGVRAASYAVTRPYVLDSLPRRDTPGVFVK